jgi:tRNA (guanosine-2'-O-)-methyltransferase
MTERREKKIMEVLHQRQNDLTVVMEDIHDPHNVSAMLRSADAVGILEVQLLYSIDTFPKLGRKSSASANKWIRRRKFVSVKECYDRLHEEGFVVCATHLGKRSKSLYDLDFTRKIALVFGNEHRGVSTEAASLADENFQIPMAGMIQSLNVSVACAVSLYEAFRQRSAGRNTGSHALNDETIRALYDEWTRK